MSINVYQVYNPARFEGALAGYVTYSYLIANFYNKRQIDSLVAAAGSPYTGTANQININSTTKVLTLSSTVVLPGTLTLNGAGLNSKLLYSDAANLVSAVTLTANQLTLTTGTLALSSTLILPGTLTMSALLNISGSSLLIDGGTSPQVNILTNNSTGYMKFLSTGSGNYIQCGLANSGGSTAPLYFTDINNANQWVAISNAGVAVGSATLSATAILQANSTTKGVRFPNMTTAQKGAIANTAGLVVFDTDLAKLCVNTGAAWETITSA